jgi:hypothetical protein
VAGPSGAPGRGILTGVVYLFRGSADGLLVDRGETMVTRNVTSQDTGIPSVAAATCGLSGGETKPECSRDAFGWALAIGRFGGSRYGDVVVGMGAPGRGRLLILHGGKGGISGSRSRMSYVNMPGLGGGVDRDHSGSLTTADLNRDGFTDLVVGVPYEDRVVLMRGGRDGLREVRAFTGRERGAGFGQAVATLDLDGNGRLEIVVAAPGGGGTVHVLRLDADLSVLRWDVVDGRRLGQATGPGIAIAR